MSVAARTTSLDVIRIDTIGEVRIWLIEHALDEICCSSAKVENGTDDNFCWVAGRIHCASDTRLKGCSRWAINGSIAQANQRVAKPTAASTFALSFGLRTRAGMTAML